MAWAFHLGLLGEITSRPTDLICDKPFHWAKKGCVLSIPQPAWKILCNSSPLTQALSNQQKLSTHFNSSLTVFCWGQLHLAGSRAGDSPPDLAEASEPQELCRSSSAHVWVALHKDSAIATGTELLQVALLMRCNTHHYKEITAITVIFQWKKFTEWLQNAET